MVAICSQNLAQKMLAKLGGVMMLGSVKTSGKYPIIFT
jgi:hypothetical protein